MINIAGFSWKGFNATYKHEEAFRQEFILVENRFELFALIWCVVLGTDYRRFKLCD